MVLGGPNRGQTRSENQLPVVLAGLNEPQIMALAKRHLSNYEFVVHAWEKLSHFSKRETVFCFQSHSKPQLFST